MTRDELQRRCEIRVRGHLGETFRCAFPSLAAARARIVDVTVDVAGARLRLSVADDGVGGADPGGSGLVGLRDRVEAMGGALTVESRPGRGTRLTADPYRRVSADGANRPRRRARSTASARRFTPSLP
jgi:hypothetical protein